MSIKVFHCGKNPDNSDVRALAELLQSHDLSETAFHRLLERHPSLLGPMGYLEFASEVPVRTRDNSGDWIAKPQEMHRADIVGVRLELSGNFQKAQKFANVIELKAVSARVINKKTKRGSNELNHALDQINEYSQALVAGGLPSIMLHYGWKIWNPAKTVIMGRGDEFDSPGQLAALRQDLLNRHGVQLVLADDVLAKAVMAMNAPDWSSIVGSLEGMSGLTMPTSVKSSLIVASGGLGANILASERLGTALTAYGDIDVSYRVPDGLAHLKNLRLQPLARKLGIPYFEAMTGFREFRRGGEKRWGAVKSGVVVADFNEKMLLSAHEEREERNRPRREKRRLHQATKAA